MQFSDVWPVLRFGHQKGTELGLPSGAPGKNHHRPGDGERNFPAEIFFHQGQGQIDPRGDPARSVDIPVASEDEVGIDLNRRV